MRDRMAVPSGAARHGRPAPGVLLRTAASALLRTAASALLRTAAPAPLRTAARIFPAAVLLAALVAPPAPAFAATTGGETAQPITLEQALDLAARNAPQAIQAQGQKRAADTSVRSAYGGFLPSVSVSAGASRRLPAGTDRTRIEDGQIVTIPDEPWSYSSGVGVNVTLFEGGRRISDLRQARARSDAAEVNLVTQKYATDLNVKQRFFEVLAARESEAAARAQLEQAEQQMRAASARLRVQAVTRSDSLRAEIQVRSAQLAVTDAASAIETANAALSRAVGSIDLITAADESFDPINLRLDEAQLRALAEAGPAVRQAEVARRSAQAAVQGTWAGYLPTVTAGYSRGGSAAASGFTLSPDGTAYSGSARLSVSLPIFNQFQREGQVTQAKVTAANTEAALRDARLAAREDLTRLLAAFRTSTERIVSLAATVELSEEDLRVQQQRYAVGSSTLLDVLASQTQLDTAKRDLIRSRYDQRIAAAQLDALVGTTL